MKKWREKIKQEGKVSYPALLDHKITQEESATALTGVTSKSQWNCLNEHKRNTACVSAQKWQNILNFCLF